MIASIADSMSPGRASLCAALPPCPARRCRRCATAPRRQSCASRHRTCVAEKMSRRAVRQPHLRLEVADRRRAGTGAAAPTGRSSRPFAGSAEGPRRLAVRSSAPSSAGESAVGGAVTGDAAAAGSLAIQIAAGTAHHRLQARGAGPLAQLRRPQPPEPGATGYHRAEHEVRDRDHVDEELQEQRVVALRQGEWPGAARRSPQGNRRERDGGADGAALRNRNRGLSNPGSRGRAR